MRVGGGGRGGGGLLCVGRWSKLGGVRGAKGVYKTKVRMKGNAKRKELERYKKCGGGTTKIFEENVERINEKECE